MDADYNYQSVAEDDDALVEVPPITVINKNKAMKSTKWKDGVGQKQAFELEYEERVQLQTEKMKKQNQPQFKNVDNSGIMVATGLAVLKTRSRLACQTPSITVIGSASRERTDENESPPRGDQLVNQITIVQSKNIFTKKATTLKKPLIAQPRLVSVLPEASLLVASVTATELEDPEMTFQPEYFERASVLTIRNDHVDEYHTNELRARLSQDIGSGYGDRSTTSRHKVHNNYEAVDRQRFRRNTLASSKRNENQTGQMPVTLSLSSSILAVRGYTKIRSNEIHKKLTINEACLPAPCDCTKSEEAPCSNGSNCVNKLMMIECSKENCPAGSRCENQNFGKGVCRSVEVRSVDRKGLGLFAMENIPADSFILEYVGEIINTKEYMRRESNMLEKKNGFVLHGHRIVIVHRRQAQR